MSLQDTSSVYCSKSHENGLNQWEKTIDIQSSVISWDRSYGLRWYLEDVPRWRLCNYNWNHWGRVTHICIIDSDNGSELEYKLLDHWEQTSVTFQSKFIYLHSGKYIWKCRPFCFGLNVLSGKPWVASVSGERIYSFDMSVSVTYTVKSLM